MSMFLKLTVMSLSLLCLFNLFSYLVFILKKRFLISVGFTRLNIGLIIIKYTRGAVIPVLLLES